MVYFLTYYYNATGCIPPPPLKSLGYYELRKNMPWFHEECSKLLDQRKQAKLQWLPDPSEINGDNLNNLR
jgi:hypothetical protein